MKNKNHAHEHSADCQHHPHEHLPHHHGLVKDIQIAFWLNLLFAFIELIGGYLTSSMAVMSDALHDFGDAISLGFAGWAEKQKQKKADLVFGFGFHRWSVLSALALHLLLILGALAMLFHSGRLLLVPSGQEPFTWGMMGLAVLGVLINGIVFWRLSREHSSHTLRGALSLHFIEDLLGWIAVLVGAVVIHWTQWHWLDPLLASAISLWILWRVRKTIRKPLRVLLQAVPEGVDLQKLRELLCAQALVRESHHLHVWSLDGEQHVLTTHLVLHRYPQEAEWQELKLTLKQQLRQQFQIVEASLEFEVQGEPCQDSHCER